MLGETYVICPIVWRFDEDSGLMRPVEEVFGRPVLATESKADAVEMVNQLSATRLKGIDLFRYVERKVLMDSVRSSPDFLEVCDLPSPDDHETISILRRYFDMNSLGPSTNLSVPTDFMNKAEERSVTSAVWRMVCPVLSFYEIEHVSDAI